MITQTIDVFAGIEDILLWRLHVAHVSAIVFVAYQLLVLYPQARYSRDTAEIQPRYHRDTAEISPPTCPPQYIPAAMPLYILFCLNSNYPKSASVSPVEVSSPPLLA